MIEWLYNNFLNALCALFFAVIGYFAEIQGAVHVMWAALALDLVSGIMASMIARREEFSMSKAFVAVGRAIGVTVLVLLLYGMDKEMHQDFAATYNIAAWLFAGFYAYSAAGNMDDLFGGKIFKVFKGFFMKRVQDQTGVDINDGSVHYNAPLWPSSQNNWQSANNHINNTQNENGD